MAVIGYARVSTDGQTLQAQTEALQGVGCARIFAEKISGAHSDRPQLDPPSILTIDRLSNTTGNGATLLRSDRECRRTLVRQPLTVRFRGFAPATRRFGATRQSRRLSSLFVRRLCCF
jgi:Resolvase, N terminal domain